jgi:iron complex outermembrane receptor protein
MIPLEAIDHIEINKTSNSVLYGDGATSGTINIVTKTNLGNLSVVSAGVTSLKGLQSNFYLSRQLEDTDYSVFGRQLTSDNYRDNSNGSEYSLGTNLIKHIDLQTELGVRAFWSREMNNLPGALPFIYLNTSPKSTEVPGYQYGADVTTASLTVFGLKRIGDVELDIDFNSRRHNDSNSYNYNASIVAAPSSGYQAANWSQSFSNSNSETTTNSLSPRIKINEFLTHDNSILLGYDFLSSQKTLSSYKSDANYTPATPISSNNYPIDNNDVSMKHQTSGVYARDTWNVSPSDQILYGYRYETYHQTYFNNAYYDYNPQLTTYPTEYNSSGNVRAYELQFNKKINSSATAYARSAQSFRIANLDDNANSANSNPVGNSNLYDNVPLLPQTSKDLEAGINYKTQHNTLSVNYFYSTIINEIAYDPSQGSINLDPTMRRGVGFHDKTELSQNFDLKLNVQYVNAIFRQGAYAGNEIPNVSPVNGNLSVDYKVNREQTFTATTRFAQSKYMSGDYSNDMAKTPGYAVEDLSYIYRQSNWSVIGTLSNVLNKNYTDTGVYSPYNQSPYILTVYPNPGRTLSLMGRYVF